LQGSLTISKKIYSLLFKVLIKVDNSSKLPVVPNISLRALISALIKVRSDFKSPEFVAISFFEILVGKGVGDELTINLTGVGLLIAKTDKPKLIRHKKNITIKTLPYFSIFVLLLNIALFK